MKKTTLFLFYLLTSSFAYSQLNDMPLHDTAWHHVSKDTGKIHRHSRYTLGFNWLQLINLDQTQQLVSTGNPQNGYTSGEKIFNGNLLIEYQMFHGLFCRLNIGAYLYDVTTLYQNEYESYFSSNSGNNVFLTKSYTTELKQDVYTASVSIGKEYKYRRFIFKTATGLYYNRYQTYNETETGIIAQPANYSLITTKIYHSPYNLYGLGFNVSGYYRIWNALYLGVQIDNIVEYVTENITMSNNSSAYNATGALSLTSGYNNNIKNDVIQTAWLVPSITVIYKLSSFRDHH